MKVLGNVVSVVGLISVMAEQQGLPSAPRTLTVAIRFETIALAPKATTAQGVNGTLRLFNAQLTYTDGAGSFQPYLAESVPQLNTDCWRVHPDGRMDVIYTLRRGLTWQDGKPLTSEDFVFSHRPYRHRPPDDGHGATAGLRGGRDALGPLHAAPPAHRGFNAFDVHQRPDRRPDEPLVGKQSRGVD